MTTKWDLRFLALAKQVASWSKDPSTKVGAVIVNPSRRPISFGYNGLPEGIADDPAILNDREAKLRLVVHAEENALLNATSPVAGCTMYVWPFMPCQRCAGMIASRAQGIIRVVSIHSYVERWRDSFRLAEDVLHLRGVELTLYERAEL